MALVRRAIAAGAACLLLATAAACGDDDGEASGAGQADDLADRAGLEAQTVVDALCDSWARDHPDHPTINEYVHDVLHPLDLVNSSDPPSYSTDEIDALIVAACRNRDAEAFVDTVRDGLALTEAALEALVGSACDRYGTQQQRMARGDWSGEDIAQFVRDLAADKGVDLGELREALSGICAES